MTNVIPKRRSVWYEGVVNRWEVWSLIMRARTTCSIKKNEFKSHAQLPHTEPSNFTHWFQEVQCIARITNIVLKQKLSWAWGRHPTICPLLCLSLWDIGALLCELHEHPLCCQFPVQLWDASMLLFIKNLKHCSNWHITKRRMTVYGRWIWASEKW